MSKKELFTPDMMDQQRLVAVHAFSIAALGFNVWIASVGAREDAGMDFWDLQQGKEQSFISALEWRRNLAAMRIMQTLAYSIDESSPLAILTEIPVAEDLYRDVDVAVGQVGLNRLPDYDINVMESPIQCFLKDAEPETKIARVVQQARMNRGVVAQEVTTEAMENASEEETLEDLQIMPNGTLAEIHRLPEVSSRVIEIPFYKQYVSSLGGAETYLRAFIEDVKWVSSQF
jgi:hypothetical protein